jgi:hypothetical protein
MADEDDEDEGEEPTPSKEAAPLPAGRPGAADWPPSLQNYVSRCFNQCVTDKDDQDMVEVILKGKITAAASSNTLWIKNWDSEPLPSNLSNSKVVPVVPMPLGSQGKVVRAGPERGCLFGTIYTVDKEDKEKAELRSVL